GKLLILELVGIGLADAEEAMRIAICFSRNDDSKDSVLRDSKRQLAGLRPRAFQLEDDEIVPSAGTQGRGRRRRSGIRKSGRGSQLQRSIRSAGSCGGGGEVRSDLARTGNGAG